MFKILTVSDKHMVRISKNKKFHSNNGYFYNITPPTNTTVKPFLKNVQNLDGDGETYGKEIASKKC